MKDLYLKKQNVMESLGDTAPRLHQTVFCLMTQEAGRGKLLDVPSGEGKLSYMLKQEGFDVTAADIDDTVFKMPGIDFRQVDLNGALPFENEYFDYILCAEGIEHVENTYHVMRELSRVIKPGGKLFITTPNILSIHSRLRFLLLGHFAFFGGYYDREENFYTYHINPSGFPQLYKALDKAGLAIEKLTSNRSVLAGRSFPVQLILIGLALIARFSTYIKEEDPYIKKSFISKDMLMGENLIAVCKKIER